MKIKLLKLVVALLCSLSTHAQQNVVDSLQHQSYNRHYIVHTPPGYTTNEDLPVVIVLHGGSGTNQNVQGFTEMNTVSNANNFLAIYPQGAGIAPPGYSWADGRNTTADQAGIDDVGFISKLIDQLAMDYSIDTHRIYICGFSNGGFMTQRLACEIPEKFAAMSGLGCSMDTSLYRTCTPNQAVPMAYFFGTSDPEVPYEGGVMKNPQVKAIVPVDTAVQFWVENNNCQKAELKVDIANTVTTDNSEVEFYKYTQCDCDADFYFYKVIGGGHTWPGVPIPQFPQLGNTNEDIHASYMVWDFFKQFAICDRSTALLEASKTSIASLYPNPTEGVVQIQSTKEVVYAKVHSILGEQFIVSVNSSQSVDITEQDSGIYFIEIVFLDGTQMTFKVIKK